MNELERDLTIDMGRLDAEWIALPSVYFAYREESDKLDAMMRKAKVELDIAMARADAELRQHPRQHFGCDKATEAQVKNAAEADPEVSGIKLKIVELTKRRSILSSAVAALEMKRDALKNLVVLQNSEYFSAKAALPADSGNGDFDVQRRNIRREIRDRLKAADDCADNGSADATEPQETMK